MILILRNKLALGLATTILLGMSNTIIIATAKPTQNAGISRYRDTSVYTEFGGVLSTRSVVSNTEYDKYTVGRGNGFVMCEDGKYVDIEEFEKITNSSIAQIVDIQINDGQEIRVGVTVDYASNNYTKVENKDKIAGAESSVEESTTDIDVKSILNARAEAKRELKEEAEKAAIEAARQKLRDEANSKTYKLSKEQGGLLDITNPDPNYTGQAIKLSEDERWIVERLVMGEAGNQGIEGAALVAQCLRDTLLLEKTDKVSDIRIKYGYTGSLKWTPNQDVIDAVAFIFDQGGYCVKHRVMFFYAPKLCDSKWHESQPLVIHYKDHRFFDRSY